MATLASQHERNQRRTDFDAKHRWNKSLPCGAIELMTEWLKKRTKELPINAAIETGDTGWDWAFVFS